MLFYLITKTRTPSVLVFVDDLVITPLLGDSSKCQGSRGSLVPAAAVVLCLHCVVAGVGEVRTPRHHLF